MKDKSIVFGKVCFSYEKGQEVIHDLSFEIKQGCFCTILGDNGSGKSTVAKLICSVLEPTGGSVSVEGYAGLVFQNPVNQMVGLTVEEEVAFGPENLGLSSSEIKSKVSDALQQVGLSGKEKDLVETLSGGQVQALALAGILAMDSQIIVCDESLSMLDFNSKNETLALLHKLSKQGKTVVYITNDVDETKDSDMVLELKS